MYREEAPGVAKYGGERDRAQCIEGIRGRVAQRLCASANGRKKTSLAGGAEATVTQGKEMI